MWQRIILVNGALTTTGLLIDIAGVVALNSLAVAGFGVALGICDTITFYILSKRRKK